MASVHAMPFLVMNLGAEMIFILEQRLQAQSVPKEKATRVLQDVLTTMFDANFLNELMRPQQVYSTAGIREIFDKLAHSSIMRLSENSMDKLYELMITGTKQAFVTARHPNDLIEVTMNHFDSLRLLVGDAFAPVATAAQRFEAMAKQLSVGALANVQKTLLTFFAAKKIKVTLFLQEKLQNADGSFNITMSGPVYQHPAVEVPGAIRYFDCGSSPSAVESFLPAGAGNQTNWTTNPNGNKTASNPFIASQRTTTLGRNIFLTERKKDTVPNGLPSAKDGAAIVTSTTAVPEGAAGSGASIIANAVSDPKMMRTKDLTTIDATDSFRFQGSFAVGKNSNNTTTAGLNSLAHLAGASPSSGGGAAAVGGGGFKLSNLFGEEDAGADSDTISLPNQNVVRFTAATDQQLNEQIKGIANDFDGAVGSSKKRVKTEEEELLDLIS